MAGLIHELIGVLQQELQSYDALLQMSNEKTAIVVKGDMGALQQITQKEQEFITKLARCEKSRQSIIEDIGLVLSIDPKELTLSKLIQLLKREPEDAKRLEDCQQKMTAVLQVLKESNEQNKNLIHHSLELIDFTVNAIQTSHSVANHTYAYGGNEEQKSNRSFFDKKQ